MNLTMGTRGSALALAQARQVARHLEALHPGLTVAEQVIRTTGDARQNAPLPEIGGKGVFTLEIEAALLDGSIDFAVHSLKDLPPEMPPGLTIAAIPAREDASDCCILHPDWSGLNNGLDAWPFLHEGARVGTSSLRRRAQLLHRRPDLQISDIRGNIDTRLKKMASGDFDALILAAAGLNRLNADRDEPLVPPARVISLNQSTFVPAPGQGALAIQSRSDDAQTHELLRALDDYETRAQVEAERSLVRALHAGCSTPLGARAYSNDSLLTLSARVLSPDGARMVEAEAYGTLEDAAYIGEECAALLQAQGAEELLN